MISPHGKREIVASAIATIVLVLVCGRYMPYLIPLPVLAFLFVISFFRDPDRTVPDRDDVLVSPADGTITDVTMVNASPLEESRCRRIGIFLSVLNCHVNRSPGDGTVTNIEYQEGAFHNAMSDEASAENESNAIVVEQDGGSFAVKQIAGLLARRIVCSVSEGEEVFRGERIGIIKFGSRTELFVPENRSFQVAVEEGDHVYGGHTILGTFVSKPDEESGSQTSGEVTKHEQEKQPAG